MQTLKACVNGSINLLGLAKRLRIPILLASTSEVYGDPQVHPQTEDYWGHVNPIGRRSCYDEGTRPPRIDRCRPGPRRWSRAYSRTGREACGALNHPLARGNGLALRLG